MGLENRGPHSKSNVYLDTNFAVCLNRNLKMGHTQVYSVALMRAHYCACTCFILQIGHGLKNKDIISFYYSQTSHIVKFSESV